MYFSSAISNASQSLLANPNLVTKIYFPRLVIPASSCLAGLLDLGIAASVLLLLLPAAGVAPHRRRPLLLPALVALLLLLALGCGLWLAALKVEYRDFQYIVPFLSSSGCSSRRCIYPMPSCRALRALLLPQPARRDRRGLPARRSSASRPVPWPLLGGSAVSAAVILASGLWYFRRVERGFADVI